MKRYPYYRIPIGYMLLFAFFIFASGTWLFLLPQGLAQTGSPVAALQQLVHTPAVKSWQQFVEIAAPHLFAMGALIFIVAHFLLFSTKISWHFSMRLSLWLYIAMFLDIFAYALIITGIVTSGWIKLTVLAIFALLFLFLLGAIAVSLLQ
ncbi:MAG TPA: hypothetical protein ENJ71_02765 [Epsilonproteobacteria bacterium]|nr:hypothetical protein [Campylobacterota bacterium]